MKTTKSPLPRRSLKGFTIVEVIMSALIFSLTSAGIFATFTALKKPASEKSRALAASETGKRVLEEWRKNVSAETWDLADSPLATTPQDVFQYYSSTNVDGTTFKTYRNIQRDATGGATVTLRINWQEY